MKQIIAIALVLAAILGAYLVLGDKSETETEPEAASDQAPATDAEPSAAEQIKDAAQDAADAVSETAEQASEAATEAAEQAADSVNDAVDAASEAATEAKEAASEAAEEAADTAAEVTEQAQDAAADVAEAASSAAESAADFLTLENFDMDKVLSAIDASSLDEATKSALNSAVQAAKDSPELLQAALDQVKQALGL